MKYEKSCGAVIFDNDKVLVIQQVAGHWGFPKGHVEQGETELETAKREIKEETNLDVEIDETKRNKTSYRRQALDRILGILQEVPSDSPPRGNAYS